MNLLETKVNPNCLLFSQRERVAETWGVGGGNVMVLGKLSTNMDNSRARTYCACSRYGWELFGHFFSHLSFLFFLPLLETVRYGLKYCLKGTNQPNSVVSGMRKPVYSCYHVYSSLDKNTCRRIDSDLTTHSTSQESYLTTLCCCIKFAKQLSQRKTRYTSVSLHSAFYFF